MVQRRGRPPVLRTLFFLLAAATAARGEEQLPPGCSIFRGRACDRALQTCLFNNSSSQSRQCACYEEQVRCLRAIDPKECMRGNHCVLYRNGCTQFYCKPYPERCAPCYSTREADVPVPQRNIFLQFVSTPSGAALVAVLALVGTYQCVGFSRKVLFEGASCELQTCPQYERWRWFCRSFQRAPRSCRRTVKRWRRQLEARDGGGGATGGHRNKAKSSTRKKQRKKRKQRKQKRATARVELDDNDDEIDDRMDDGPDNAFAEIEMGGEVGAAEVTGGGGERKSSGAMRVDEDVELDGNAEFAGLLDEDGNA